MFSCLSLYLSVYRASNARQQRDNRVQLPPDHPLLVRATAPSIADEQEREEEEEAEEMLQQQELQQQNQTGRNTRQQDSEANDMVNDSSVGLQPMNSPNRTANQRENQVAQRRNTRSMSGKLDFTSFIQIDISNKKYQVHTVPYRTLVSLLILFTFLSFFFPSFLFCSWCQASTRKAKVCIQRQQQQQQQ